MEVPAEGLADAVRGMRAMGFRGGNFTIPHKVAVIEHLDGLTEAAELMGAVNCVYRDGQRLIGENTDGKGFVQSLAEIADPANKSVTILGAGGAARAIAVELALAGARRIDVVNRSHGRGKSLVELLDNSSRLSSQVRLLPWVQDHRVAVETEILINATSIGLGDEAARVPIDTTTFRPGLVVADVIFNPAETLLLKQARDAGCTVLDGLGMLVNQGVISFKTWTGIDPDPQVMRSALEEYLGI
jgi:shikimate dehydrogenase